MTRDAFDALVKRLEGISQQNPRSYLLRLAGLVVLAYGYLGLILFGTLALMVAVVGLIIAVPNGATIKLGIIALVVLGGLFWAVARGLWVRMEPPEGLLVTPRQAPALFAMLDELRAALDCKPFHRVLLVGDHNAAVVQIPRLGVFGWHHNYLLLGLPLMQSLAPEEFKAVLAHEFAHSSRGHGRFGNWLYRVRRSWERIFEQMARQQTRGGWLFSKFIEWFWPVFNAHAFVLARANEYEADACSVRLAGAEAAAGALMRLPVDGNFLSEKFWPDLYSRATNEKEPPAEVMLLLGQSLRQGPATEDATRWLKQAFLLETNNSDTHPSLKDRLRAIGRLPANLATQPPPAPPRQTAAHFFLGEHEAVAARTMSADWHKAIAHQWATRHEQAQQTARELAEFEKSSAAPPKPEDLWNKARKLIDLHGDAAALPVLQELLVLDPRHAAANFVCGRHQLEKDDPTGVSLIEAALATDPTLTPDGCNLLYGHFARTGQRDKLRPLEERMDQFQEVARFAQIERGNITASDTFLPTELSPAQTTAVRTVMEAEPEIVATAVARKQVRHFPSSPCFVVSLRLKTSWWKPRSSTASQQLVNRVIEKLQLPGYFLVFVDEQNLRSLAKKIFAVPGAVVFERPPKG